MARHSPMVTGQCAEPGIGDTPLVAVTVPLPGRSCRLWLKLEGANRYGSIKARTAYALVRAREREGRLVAGGAVVESTSGNLGTALAGICRARGYRCTIVGDPDTPRHSRDLIVAAGAELIIVPPAPGGDNVARRLAVVRRILAERPGTVWTDQYGSHANPEIHRSWTAPELLEGLAGVRLDGIAAVVSTGGTLAGLSAFFRTHSPWTKVICVDAAGSAATGGVRTARPLKIPGFGSGRRSELLRPGDWDIEIRVDDLHAALACQVFLAATGIALGGSSGGAVLGAVLAALADRNLGEIGVICADLGRAYQDTVYATRYRHSATADPTLRDGLAALSRAARVHDRLPKGRQ